jgi:hypothetical protein
MQPVNQINDGLPSTDTATLKVGFNRDMRVVSARIRNNAIVLRPDDARKIANDFLKAADMAEGKEPNKNLAKVIYRFDDGTVIYEETYNRLTALTVPVIPPNYPLPDKWDSRRVMETENLVEIEIPR